MASDPGFRNRVAIVTGASSGIGSAIAVRLAAAGARLVLTGRGEARLDEAAAHCSSQGVQTCTVAGDLTDADVRQRVVERAIDLGGIDLLVHNAGVTMNARFEDLEAAVLRRIFEINFFAAADLTALALADLRRRRGRILIISSLTGIVGTPTRTAYAASKHALHGLFDSLRVELRDDGVGVTIVCPGYVATPMRRRALLGDGREQGFDQAAERRMLSADAVASASLRAVARGRRLVLLGRETRLARLLSILAPSRLDAILARTTR